MRDYEKMTVKELVEELTGLGVSFNKKSRKAELIELLQAETEGKAPKPAGEADAAETEAKTKAAEEPVSETGSESKSAEKTKSSKKEKPGKAVPADSGYAIIRTGGKQYQVTEGSLVRVEKIAGNVGDTVTLTDVLAVFDGDTSKIGQPKVDGAVVTARIVEQNKAKKILVFKKKRRKGYRVKRGHRQMYTALEISEITV